MPIEQENFKLEISKMSTNRNNNLIFEILDKCEYI